HGKSHKNRNAGGQQTRAKRLAKVFRGVSRHHILLAVNPAPLHLAPRTHWQLLRIVALPAHLRNISRGISAFPSISPSNRRVSQGVCPVIPRWGLRGGELDIVGMTIAHRLRACASTSGVALLGVLALVTASQALAASPAKRAAAPSCDRAQ